MDFCGGIFEGGGERGKYQFSVGAEMLKTLTGGKMMMSEERGSPQGIDPVVRVAGRLNKAVGSRALRDAGRLLKERR